MLVTVYFERLIEEKVIAHATAHHSVMRNYCILPCVLVPPELKPFMWQMDSRLFVNRVVRHNVRLNGLFKFFCLKCTFEYFIRLEFKMPTIGD